MTANVIQMNVPRTLADYENHLFNGYEQWKAHPVTEDDEVIHYVVYFMDVEYDPIRVTIDLDGNVTMPDNEETDYLIMSPKMLGDLADIASDIENLHSDD